MQAKTDFALRIDIEAVREYNKTKSGKQVII